jgi:hypothetical protein
VSRNVTQHGSLRSGAALAPSLEEATWTTTWPVLKDNGCRCVHAVYVFSDRTEWD